MSGDDLPKFDGPTIEEVANKNQIPSKDLINKNGSIERGEIPLAPILSPQIGFWETVQTLFSLKTDEAVVNGLAGKPMNLPSINPLAIIGISSKLWKIIAAVLFAALAVLLGWQYVKSKTHKSD